MPYHQYIAYTLDNMRRLFIGNGVNYQLGKTFVAGVYNEVIQQLQDLVAAVAKKTGEKSSELTFAQVKKQVRQFDIQRMAALYRQVMMDSTVQKLISDQSSSLPFLNHSRFWHDFYQYNEDYRAAIESLNLEVSLFLSNLSSGSSRKVDFSSITKRIASFRELEESYYNAIIAMTELFPSADNTMDFSNSAISKMGIIFNWYYESSKKWLIEEYNGFLADYVKMVESTDILKENNLTIEEIKQCVQL